MPQGLSRTTSRPSSTERPARWTSAAKASSGLVLRIPWEPMKAILAGLGHPGPEAPAAGAAGAAGLAPEARVLRAMHQAYARPAPHRVAIRHLPASPHGLGGTCRRIVAGGLLGTEKPMDDLARQLDMLLRLVVAAVLGGMIGFEREVHEHPAGMRTHLLVSLGSALFTVLSISAFDLGVAPNGSIPVDPSRIAAQVVSGIGFLGAGAILKYGTTVKGLTTAANLWATAAVGMAAGAGSLVLAAGGTAIVLASLWPLQVLLDKASLRRGKSMRITLALADLTPLAALTAEAGKRRIEIADLRTSHARNGGYELELDLRLPPGAVPNEVAEALGQIDGARLLGVSHPHDRDA